MQPPWIQQRRAPVNFSFLCTIISPWTGQTEIDAIKDAISDGRLDWQAVTEYANRANLAPALREALTAKGLWRDVPEILREYLTEMYRFNAERNKAILHNLSNVIAILNQAGITPLPMKGGAALAADVYPDPAIRFMMDLDILVPNSMRERSISALMEGGYFVPEEHVAATQNWDWEKAKHYPPLVKMGMVAHVELHRNVLNDSIGHLLPAEKIWQDSRPFTGHRMKDLTFSLMSPTHQVLHCIIHSEIAHGYFELQRLDLRQLLHFAHLSKRYTGEIEWNKVAAVMSTDTHGEILRAYLYNARTLFNVVTPITPDQDEYAQDRFSKLVHFNIEGKWKRLRGVHQLLNNIMKAFSKHGLLTRYPELRLSTTGQLRMHHIGVLIGRYSRAENFKKYINHIGSLYFKTDRIG